MEWDKEMRYTFPFEDAWGNKKFKVQDAVYAVKYDDSEEVKQLRLELEAMKQARDLEIAEKMRKEREEKEMSKTVDRTLLEMQAAMIKVIAETNSEAILEKMMPEIENRIIERYGCVPQVHEIRTPETKFEVKGVVHEKFDEILGIVNCDIPVYLVGPAGTGKNVICKQVAESLGLEFYFSNAITQEYKLTGFIDANGNYQKTQFYEAFTKGGLFFLDEIDASIPEVLVILNAAIANRYFDFPTGKIEAHPNFRVIAAGNTIGLGADNNYTGRYQLDRASLDRFAMVQVDYSPAIEDAMSRGDKELAEFARCFRKAAKDVGVECICSYRTIERIALLKNVYNNIYENLSVSLLKGLPTEDVDTIRKKLKGYQQMRDNRYAKALFDYDF